MLGFVSLSYFLSVFVECKMSRAPGSTRSGCTGHQIRSKSRCTYSKYLQNKKLASMCMYIKHLAPPHPPTHTHTHTQIKYYSLIYNSKSITALILSVHKIIQMVTKDIHLLGASLTTFCLLGFCQQQHLQNKSVTYSSLSRYVRSFSTLHQLSQSLLCLSALLSQ